MKNYPVSRKANLVVQEMDGEVLIYDLTEDKAFCLNETSALVWQACDGEKSTAEISEFISQKLKSPVNEDLVWFALDQLKKEKLLENKDELPNHFAGMSRREVIKRVGLGSVVALPIIAGLVAPTPALSSSSCGNMCTCNMLGPNPGGNWNDGEICGTDTACPPNPGAPCGICISIGNSMSPLMDNCFFS